MSCLEHLLMSRMFRRYIECVTVVLFPWVLLSEQEAETMEGSDEDDEAEDLYLHSGAVPSNGHRG